MRTIKLTTGAALPLDGDLLTVLETLYREMTAKHDLERTFEDTIREIQHVIDQLTDDERRQYLVREPVPQLRVLRERAARRLHEAAVERSLDQSIGRPPPTCPSTTSPPGSLQLAVEHHGPAVRRPHGLRLQRSLRASACSATPAPRRCRRSGPANAPRRCAATSMPADRSSAATAPLKLPLKKDERAARAAARRRATPLAALHRVHRGVQHLVRPGLLRAGNRHHPHPPGRDARFRPLHAGRRRSRPVARPDRLLQLRRGVPPQARGGDVRVHQVALPARLPLHEHQRARVHRRRGRAAWCTPGSTR